MDSREFLTFQLVDEESNINGTYRRSETYNALVSRYAPQKLSQGSAKLFPALLMAFVALQTATFC